MMISVNGPNLEHADSVIEATMSQYCSCKEGPSGTLREDHKHKTTLLHQKSRITKAAIHVMTIV